jgi:hypothetical protein
MSAEIEAATGKASLAAEVAAAAGERHALDARASELARRASELARREAALQLSEQKIAERETAAASKEQEADAVIALAEGLAEGVLEIDPASDQPAARKTEAAAAHPGFAALMARIKKGGTTVKRALGAFHRAFGVLRGNADEQAQARVREQTAEIRQADDQIVEIASLLPSDQRSRISDMRAVLVGRIMRLSRLNDRPDSANRQERPDPDEQR